jgi:DNA-binding MarR family transcriptional regulator
VSAGDERPATTEPTDAAPTAVWSGLVAVYQGVLHDVVAILGDRAGIDSGIFSALAYLERADPPHQLAMSELQRLLHPRYSQPGLSRLVQRMEADRLVERRRDPADGRAAILVSTRAGRRAYERASSVYTAAVHEHFDRHLDDGDAAILADAFARVVARRAAASPPRRRASS